MKIGGVTTHKKITLVSLKANIDINYKTGSFIIKTNSICKEKKIETIPFIRGFYKLYKTFKMLFKTLIGKIALGLTFFGIFSMILSLVSSSSNNAVSVSSTISKSSNLLFIVYTTASFMFLIGMVFYIWRIRHYHGLEHKFISFLNTDKNITINNILSQSKETPKCGGVLLAIIIVINTLIVLLNGPFWLIWILVPSLGYELFLLADGNKWYNKIIFFPGYLIQQLTTGNKVPSKNVELCLPAINAYKKYLNNN